MGACPGCEALPLPMATDGVLYLCPPLGHTRTKLLDLLESRRLAWKEPAENVVAIDWKAASQLLEMEFDNVLSDVELKSTRCLILSQNQTPSIADLARMESLNSLLARKKGEWLIELIRENRLATYFQPIVETHHPDDVFAYECLLRGVGHDGHLVSPDRMYAVAREARLLFQLDRAARLKHIHSSMQYGLTTKIFINFNPSSVYDPVYCLRSTVNAVRNSAATPDRFVFEVVESEVVDDPQRLVRILEYFRDNGFLVALDDFGSGYSSIDLLTRLKPDFIKLDAHLIRHIDSDPYKAQILAKIFEMARELDVLTIAEGVETAEEYDWVLEHGADYVQGYLFGRPSSVPEVAQVAVS